MEIGAFRKAEARRVSTGRYKAAGFAKTGDIERNTPKGRAHSIVMERPT